MSQNIELVINSCSDCIFNIRESGNAYPECLADLYIGETSSWAIEPLYEGLHDKCPLIHNSITVKLKE